MLENITDVIKNLPTHDKDVFTALKNSFYPGASDESVYMAMTYCRAASLDPMMKPVHLVPMRVKHPVTEQYEWRDVVMPGIGLYRIQASRTGAHMGTSEPEFGPIIKRKLGNIEVEFPEWCKVVVKRIVNDQIVEFIAKEFWLENYATAGKDTKDPNAMWKKRPFAQLAKCAEAQALRKAFPEIGSQPTAEEMEGKTIDVYDYENITNTKNIKKDTVDFSTVVNGQKETKADEQAREIDVAEMINFDTLHKEIKAASNTKELKAAGEKVSKFKGSATELQLLRDAYSKRQKELKAASTPAPTFEELQEKLLHCNTFEEITSMHKLISQVKDQGDQEALLAMCEVREGELKEAEQSQ